MEPTPRTPPFWTRHLRREVQFLLDAGVFTVAFALAYLLRFDFRIPLPQLGDALIQLPLVVLLELGVVVLVGIHHFVWRYVGMAEVQTFVKAATYSAVPLLLMRLGLPEAFNHWRIPLSVILMNAVFAFGGLLGLRVLRRALYERYERRRRESSGRADRRYRVLLAGAGSAGIMAAREIRGRGGMDLELLGFVDDDPLKQGTVIQGLRVLGATVDLPVLVAEHRVERVIITMAAAGAATIRRIVESCDRLGVEVRIIPAYYEILEGRVAISRFREVRIEDLLGREPVRLDTEAVRGFLSRKRVLITGAGGSIGSELARQITRFDPAGLLLLESSEGALFEIERELAELRPDLDLRPLLADAGDGRRTAEILARHRPHVVVHAAAYKHVPMMESHVAAAVRNNVLATDDLARRAGEAGVEAFLLISTDKAVRPASVMGATKRLAEQIIQDLDRRFPATRFVAVRFGNVLGSAGSVVPIFQRQIARGGPVTITHADARRYFMTPAEAAQLVLEAGALGHGGEIMILDMGRPIRILDLAKDLIALSGYRPFEDIPITFTGLRPGEKLFEELELSEEQVDRSRHPQIFIGRLQGPPPGLPEALERLAGLVASGSAEELRRLLGELVPESDLTAVAPGAAGLEHLQPPGTIH